MPGPSRDVGMGTVRSKGFFGQPEREAQAQDGERPLKRIIEIRRKSFQQARGF